MFLSNLSKLRILDIISVSLRSIQMAVLILGLIEILNFLNKKKVSTFFSGFYSLLLAPVGGSLPAIERENRDAVDDRSHVCRRDLRVVLRSLALFVEGEDQEGNIPVRLDADSIVEMFEEKSFTLCEIKEAFQVFDENGDGFIEPAELQMVLCALGFREGSGVERCRGMIRVFDENRDGKIDFDEFVKFMGESFWLINLVLFQL